jgi:hypothetical protein
MIPFSPTNTSNALAIPSLASDVLRGEGACTFSPLKPVFQICPEKRQSCSFRTFFRLRLRANASFTRFFSPGFR